MNFSEFSNKIYNPYNKAPQKFLQFFLQIWIGEMKKKDVKNAKRINNTKYPKEFIRIIDFKCLSIF